MGGIMRVLRPLPDRWTPAYLIFVIVKGIVELGRWRAKGKVQTIARNGYDDRSKANTKNCCGFHRMFRLRRLYLIIILRYVKATFLQFIFLVTYGTAD
jgi:hypothetical protein